MAKRPNYGGEKRQKEIQRQKKKEEKEEKKRLKKEEAAASNQAKLAEEVIGQSESADAVAESRVGGPDRDTGK